jgi:hypothetical protein
MRTPIRLTAKVTGHLPEPKVKHYHGLPPELSGGEDFRERLEVPALILIEEKPDGVFLLRFTANGRVVGDTWHTTIEEAQQQAHFEFANVLSNWRSVPADVEDVVEFGLSDET